MCYYIFGVNKMIVVGTEEFAHTDFEIKNVDTVSQNWVNQRAYHGYAESPRPYSGFMLMRDDIEMAFDSSDGYTVVAKKNDIMYLPRGCRYETRVIGTPPAARDTLVNFDTEKDGEDIVFSERPIKICSDGGAYAHVFDELSVATHLPVTSPVRIKSLVYTLTWQLLTKELISGALYPIRKGVLFIEEHWNENFRISDAAFLCGMCESYFRRLFLEWSGMSPLEYRNTIRLSNAKSMLSVGTYTVREVAEAVGFDDSFYFARAFRKQTGFSPTEFMRQKNNESTEK